MQHDAEASMALKWVLSAVQHFLGEDCSSESAGLQYGRPVIREESAFE